MAKTTRTLKTVCAEIAAEFARRGEIRRNRVTGRSAITGDDVFNFSSQGELFHIYEWYEELFPDRDIQTGRVRGVQDTPQSPAPDVPHTGARAVLHG